MYFPGGQLLVVSAKYAAPALLTQKMAAKNYRDIYSDLNSASVAGTKVFIIDQSCDGLVAKPDGDQVADTFETDVRTELKRVLGLLEPAIILGMGVLVAFIVVAMLLAIFSINELPL